MIAPHIVRHKLSCSTHERRWLVMLLALLLDGVLGELPNRWHPVAWLGKLLAVARRHAPVAGRMAPFGYGLAVVGVGGLLCAIVGWLMGRFTANIPPLVSLLMEAFLLKQTLAVRGLSKAAEAVTTALDVGDLEAARHQLSWHLVSRDTDALNHHQIASATIESVAENASDSVIAPLFYYGFCGLPGAFVYRYLNTIDAMWGYRDVAREWLGKVGARADDGVNLLPARLTALLLIAASGRQTKQSWHIWWRDRRLTASPNAGHPMSAMAGALGVELVKLDHYRLGAGLSQPTTADIGSSIHLMRRAVALGICLSGLWAGWHIVKSNDTHEQERAYVNTGK